MSTKKTPSISFQVSGELEKMLRIGQSKNQAKKDEHTNSPEGIFSWSTYHSYKKHCIEFGKYAKQKHGCKYIKDALPFVKEFIEHEISRGLSAETIHLKMAAINKLYGTKAKELDIVLPERKRANITRSRGQKEHDKCFSEKENQEVVDFCRAVGPRRYELVKIRGKDLIVDENNLYVRINGKGGKLRTTLVNPNLQDIVLKKFANVQPNELVFKKGEVKSHMDVHSYRREYATMMYKLYARPLDTLKKEEKYYCRNDKKGIVYDRQAMLTVSRFLGHNRIDVIARNYIDGL